MTAKTARQIAEEAQAKYRKRQLNVVETIDAPIKSRRSRAPDEPMTNGRALIRVSAGALAEIATEAERVLLRSGVQLYQRGPALVRPIVEEVEAAHGSRTKIAQLTRINSVYLRDLLGRVAEFQKFDGRGKKWVRADPPKDTAATISPARASGSFPRSPVLSRRRRCERMARSSISPATMRRPNSC